MTTISLLNPAAIPWQMVNVLPTITDSSSPSPRSFATPKTTAQDFTTAQNVPEVGVANLSIDSYIQVTAVFSVLFTGASLLARLRALVSRCTRELENQELAIPCRMATPPPTTNR